MNKKKKVVIAGFGDTGLLVAIHLADHYDIVGISPKPCLVSGQELGARLAQPERWQKNYLMPFSRYKKLSAVRTVQGLITHIDPQQQLVEVSLADGTQQQETYDALVIAAGVSNGFWRNNAIEDMVSINQSLNETAERIARAKTLTVIGGGAAGVSVCANIAERYPEKPIHFFYSQSQPLPGYHPKVRSQMAARLSRAGVHLNPGHRAIIPDGFDTRRLTNTQVQWSTGQAPFQADVTLWATGAVKPNNKFIPEAMLDEQGFVRTDNYLRVPGFDNIFTVGDIAASDPNRSSARNGGYRLVANNVQAYLQQQEQTMKSYRASPYRWGSIVGVQKEGLRVFSPTGGSMRFPNWVVENLLFPFVVRKKIYQGIKKS